MLNNYQCPVMKNILLSALLLCWVVQWFKQVVHVRRPPAGFAGWTPDLQPFAASLFHYLVCHICK